MSLAGSKSYIHIEGARQHNLKNINVDIPRDQLIVVCGPSGSGKSTLAFDIVYAEGQRRYVESLSAYARMFLPKLDKPIVDKIEGLSPSIALEQQGITHNPRSTVGTVTEVYDFLRIFFARLGTVYCPNCNIPIQSMSIDEILDELFLLPLNTRIIILAPLVILKKGTHVDKLKKLQSEGFARIRITTQGEEQKIYNISDAPALDKNKKHTLDLVIDRLAIKQENRSRLADSLELALTYGNARVIVNIAEQGDKIYATDSSCPSCRFSMPKLTPQLFSFNSPQGACPQCMGIGTVMTFDESLIIPDQSLSLKEGAIVPFSSAEYLEKLKPSFLGLGLRYNFTLETPIKNLSKEALNALFYGEIKENNQNGSLRRNFLGGTALHRGISISFSEKYWPGIMNLLEQRMAYGDAWHDTLSIYAFETPCPTCHGTRLKKEALSVKVEGITIDDLCNMPISEALQWIEEQNFTGRYAVIAQPIIKEIKHRLSFLVNVGLDYLTLSRSMLSLSGGEAQRIRLASQLGSGLVGVTYVLDEPSIGLHPRDNDRLIHALRELQSRGNTVLVVEHDKDTILHADFVLEMGPESGMHGGQLIFAGTVNELLKNKSSLTAAYLRGDLKVPIPSCRKRAIKFLLLEGVVTNNLKNITCKIPVGCFTCVTGVSGSGKSSLVIDTLYRHVARHCGLKTELPGKLSSISGLENFDRVVIIDQTPIGRTPRSNPATYTKIFDDIRKIFAMTQDGKKHGYTGSRFSFNVPGGRCETCKGDGQIRVEMHFLPDVFVKCDVCEGKRFNKETLEVRYKGLNIADVLNLTVNEALEFFSAYPALQRRLTVLDDVGLGYLQLGQAATTLSGGEAQRIKISRELGKKALPNTLYILDEPTTGLHMHEVGKLIKILHHLTELGATVVVIEHNTDIILSSDYIIDLGPGGGVYGGKIIAEGTPEEIMTNSHSVTGNFLLQLNNNNKSELL